MATLAKYPAIMPKLRYLPKVRLNIRHFLTLTKGPAPARGSVFRPGQRSGSGRRVKYNLRLNTVSASKFLTQSIVIPCIKFLRNIIDLSTELSDHISMNLDFPSGKARTRRRRQTRTARRRTRRRARRTTRRRSERSGWTCTSTRSSWTLR